MASGVYAKGIGALVGGTIDWDAAGITINAQLTKNTYTPDLDLHDFRDDVLTHIVTGTTDQAVTGRAITYNAAANQVHLDGPVSLTWTAVGPTPDETVTGVVLYLLLGGAASADPIICWNEFAVAKVTNGSNIVVTFDTDGHIRFTY